LLEIIKGAFNSMSRQPRRLTVNTPYLNGMIEGTEFLVRVEDDRATLSVLEGKVLASNAAGSLKVAPGESATAEAGQAPQLRTLVRPRDAVHWALYYPPVLTFRPDEFPPGPGWQGMVRRSTGFYSKGDLGNALDSIATVPGTVSDPRFFAYRASLMLAVGRVDEANADIGRALKLNPNDSNGLALQAATAVVQNEKDKALTAAQKAVQAAPASATALIALSYAQQARFDLEGARASLEKAVQLEPANALAWARLAELHASFGDLDDALKAAEKAVALAPDLARTQTVLGYAYLMEVKTAWAKEAFEKARTLDQGDPLPRLGLGLAKIREGDLHEGRQEIDIAAGLDPNNSLVRSYLGKAYYEEKRTDLTDPQYAIAKELDPSDPTPFFYDAIQKQTTNRPVEALQDIQKAIELNDNRAVYRSKLLLDSDLAARSASLGRVYTDLGFQQLALVEGWKSVNTDPSNYSAHRFLADSYSVLPRHEIARVSELLQSQLLQPINTTPIQPRLAESNLFLISAGGPGASSFNEFNPIFNRDGINFQTSGLVGENNTYAGEGILAGIYEKASFSVGYSHFESDGWRKNADQDDDIANAFVQLELSPKTSIQAELRHRESETGELKLRFAPDDFLPNRRHDDETQSARLGFRHSFSPTSTLIGNFMYQDADRSVRDSPDPIFRLFDLEGDDKAYSGELQYLFRSTYVNLVTGVGHFKVDSEDDITTEFLIPEILIPLELPFPLPPITITIPPQLIRDKLGVDRDVRHTNLYAYSYTELPGNVTLTLGGSGDFFDSDIPGAQARDQFNPKVGITWNPLAGTTVRGAVFRTLKRTLVTNQTLEPTQVAGFNQFFDDFNATEAWRYGIAVDQKFSRNIYGGLEYSLRDLDVPFVASTDGGLAETEVEWNEQLFRPYLFWTPHEWVALSAGYEWERFDRDELFADGAKHVETNRVPLGINFFHPSGLSASIKGTYIDQTGDFERTGGVPFESGEDNFWTVDAAVSYRLPRRFGFITIGATNVFDEEFSYFDTDHGSVNVNPRIIPDRVFFGRITLALP
ncbi:MAG: tetratricopeptide repeat protein, partial [Gammaproteobacteria bacterium]